MLGYLTVYSILIIAASLAGGMTPMVVRLTHRRMQLATSAIAGFMLGIALWHLLTHALETSSIQSGVGWMLAGVLGMFFLERFLCFHHHTAPDQTGRAAVTADPHPPHPAQGSDHEPGPDHGPAGRHGEPSLTVDPSGSHAHVGHHHGSWLGMGLGMVVHSLLAGAVLAASIRSEHAHADHAMTEGAMPGLAVFLIILLHKPFDALALLTLLGGAGFKRGAEHLINAGFALTVPLGAVALLLGLDLHGGSVETIVGPVLAFAAGMFLCIALADLLPEVHFHSHDRVALSIAVLLGLGLAWAIHSLEAQIAAH